MYLSTSTNTEDFQEMYLSKFQVLYKLYLSTYVLKYKVLLPGSASDVSHPKSYTVIVGGSESSKAFHNMGCVQMYS